MMAEQLTKSDAFSINRKCFLIMPISLCGAAWLKTTYQIKTDRIL